jgi:hypothetical protein
VSSVFAEEIVRRASFLEQAASDGNVYYIKHNHARFIDEMDSLINDISSALSVYDEANADAKPVKSKPDVLILQKLKKACDDFDMDGAQAAVVELEEFNYTDDNGLCTWLRENVDLTNFSFFFNELERYISYGK